jgi:hypothetical protein
VVQQLAQVEKLIWTLSDYLGLDQPPPNLRLWNLNGAGEGFGSKGHQLADLVAYTQPDWVIIDPLKTIFHESTRKTVPQMPVTST